MSRAAGSTTVTGNSYSYKCVISADGQFIAFQSDATNLVTGQTDTSITTDVFAFDRGGGTTQLVSRAAGTPTTTGNGVNGWTPAGKKKGTRLLTGLFAFSS